MSTEECQGLRQEGLLACGLHTTKTKPNQTFVTQAKKEKKKAEENVEKLEKQLKKLRKMAKKAEKANKKVNCCCF